MAHNTEFGIQVELVEHEGLDRIVFCEIGETIHAGMVGELIAWILAKNRVRRARTTAGLLLFKKGSYNVGYAPSSSTGAA